MIGLFPFLGISVKYGTKNTNNTWRHEKCSYILHNPNIKRCNWCDRICTAFRSKKHENLTKRIGGTLTLNRAKTLFILKKKKHNIQKLNLRLDSFFYIIGSIKILYK